MTDIAANVVAPPVSPAAAAREISPYLARYRAGEWRATIFRDMVLDDARRLGEGLTFLDIGCGHGFDGDEDLQREVARASGRYVGVEPDPDIRQGEHFSVVHRSFFEQAPIEPGSVHVAFAIMVLEHLERPQPFFDKLHEVLADGGVFWGLTVDARHPFCRASMWAQRLKLKDRYLNLLLGSRGSERYENYPTFYRCNTPEQVRPLAARFGACEFVNFSRVGQLNDYYPRILHPIASAVDRFALRRQRPGALLAVRVVK